MNLSRYVVIQKEVKEVDVKKIRKRLKMTQIELAKLMGVTTTSVSRWETKRVSMSKLAFEKLEEICGRYQVCK